MSATAACFCSWVPKERTSRKGATADRATKSPWSELSCSKRSILNLDFSSGKSDSYHSSKGVEEREYKIHSPSATKVPLVPIGPTNPVAATSSSGRRKSLCGFFTPEAHPPSPATTLTL